MLEPEHEANATTYTFALIPKFRACFAIVGSNSTVAVNSRLVKLGRRCSF